MRPFRIIASAQLRTGAAQTLEADTAQILGRCRSLLQLLPVPELMTALPPFIRLGDRFVLVVQVLKLREE